MIKFFASTLLLLLFANQSFSQQAVFTPHGKPIIRIFSNYNSTFEDDQRGSAFELQRVYLGYEHHFNEQFSGTVVYDVGNPGFGKLEMTSYVKNAYMRYKQNNLTVNFGMISTTQFKVQESAWGYRYLEKSFQDEYKFNSSADLGMSVAYKITDFLSADVIVQNGEGYKKLEADSTFRTGFGITINPVENLTARAYYDISTKINTQSSLATFLGYENEMLSLGAEYILQLQPDFVSDREWTGLSFFGTVNLGDQVKLFSRFDRLSSNTVEGESENWNYDGDGSNFIAGFEYAPVRGIKIAPNFKGWNPADPDQSFKSTIILNVEVKF